MFVAGDAFVEVPRPLDHLASLTEVVELLAAGPLPGDGNELRSSIERGDVLGVELVAGVAEVDLAPKFRELPSLEQRRSIVQLVLTLTGRAGVGQVTFRANGKPFDVPRSDGSFGGPTVSRDDFAELLRASGAGSVPVGVGTSAPPASDPGVSVGSSSTSSSTTTSTSTSVPRRGR